MEFISDRYEHKYKQRAGVPWHQFVKCGKVSLRGYVNKEEEEDEEKEKEEEEVCANFQQSGGP
jgi:hypothetical protein